MPWHSVLATCPCFGTLDNPFKLCKIPSDQWIYVFLTMMLRSNNGCTMVYTLFFTNMYWTNIWLTPYAFWQLKIEGKENVVAACCFFNVMLRHASLWHPNPPATVLKSDPRELSPGVGSNVQVSRFDSDFSERAPSLSFVPLMVYAR